MKSATTTTSRKNSSFIIGIFLVLLGVLWLLDEMSFYIPSWIMSWQMFLIALGVVFGIQSSFRNPTSYILILIGGVFLLANYFDIPINFWQFFWPALLILIGISIMIRPKRKWKPSGDYITEEGTETSDDRFDSLRVNAIMNGINRNITSQNFKGGEISSIMGGVEINFSRADIQGEAVLNVSVVMGGLKIIVPPDWSVQIEATNILGGIEDERYSNVKVETGSKVLVLTGTVIMGGIEIVSY